MKTEKIETENIEIQLNKEQKSARNRKQNEVTTS